MMFKGKTYLLLQGCFFLLTVAGCSKNKEEKFAGSQAIAQGNEVSTADITADSVTIDVSKFYNINNHVASGFLHALDFKGLPPDSLILPLKVNRTRANQDYTFKQVKRTRQLGMKQQLVVSDYWGGYAWQDPNKIPGKNGKWKEWEDFVGENVKGAISKGISATLEFDIWNESDYSGFWPYTGIYAYPNHFYETWKHAYQKIRSMAPNAIIVGPSFSNNGGNKVQMFLDYALANNVVPDYVSWHFPVNTVQEVAGMRTYLASKHLQKNIHINEYTWYYEENAGKTAWLIAQMERAKVDAAIHAIWGSAAYGQLDGIITAAPEYNKKATWWVYKSYADITGNFISSIPGKYVDCIAGKDDAAGSLQVLLGTQETLPAGTVKVKFINAGLYTGRTLHIQLMRIPDNSGGVLENREIVMDKTITLSGGKAEINITWSSIYDAYYLIIN